MTPFLFTACLMDRDVDDPLDLVGRGELWVALDGRLGFNPWGSVVLDLEAVVAADCGRRPGGGPEDWPRIQLCAGDAARVLLAIRSGEAFGAICFGPRTTMRIIQANGG